MYSKSNKERKDNQISCTFAVSNTLNEKDMKKLAICITLIAAILTGCNGDEKAAQARLDKARAMPLRAPLLIVVIAKLQDHFKVPKSEQRLAAGCAAHGILIAAHAQGMCGTSGSLASLVMADVYALAVRMRI